MASSPHDFTGTAIDLTSAPPAISLKLGQKKGIPRLFHFNLDTSLMFFYNV